MKQLQVRAAPPSFGGGCIPAQGCCICTGI